MNDDPATLRRQTPLCPSAQPDWDGAVTFAVMAGTARAPRAIYLKQIVEPRAELLALAGPVRPTEVFRFAASCMCSGCQHFEHTQCTLATKIGSRLEPVVGELPACTIREHCRWHLEEGDTVCFRCPQVITDDTNPSQTMQVIADPAVRSASPRD